MKKFFVIAILAGLSSINASADWDPVREARDAAERKASQERSAREKAENARVKREAGQKHMREFVGKDAVGKSDGEVERLYQERRKELENRAAALETLEKSQRKNPPAPGIEGEMAQADALMKAMYGKSTSEIGRMSDKERDAFFKGLEKKYPK